jgi:isocitrate dehydrogenase
MCNFLKLFKKEKTQNKIVDLSRWHKFLSESNSCINSVLNQNNINDIGIALAHTDNKTKQRFINSAIFLNLSTELANAIKNKQNVSKYESDKAKIILLSILEAKDLTPLPGFHHL